MKTTTRILQIINLGLHANLDVKTVILSIFLAIDESRHTNPEQISIASEANNQSRLFFQVFIQLKHRNRNFDCFGGNM